MIASSLLLSSLANISLIQHRFLLDDCLTGVNVPLNEVFLKLLVTAALLLSSGSWQGRSQVFRIYSGKTLLHRDFTTPRPCSRTGQAGMLNFSFTATFLIRHLTNA